MCILSCIPYNCKVPGASCLHPLCPVFRLLFYLFLISLWCFCQGADHLIDPSFINRIRERILSNTSHDNSYYNVKPSSDHVGTTHVSVLDEDGLAVSATSTINQLWAGSLFKQRSSASYSTRYQLHNDTFCFVLQVWRNHLLSTNRHHPQQWAVWLLSESRHSEGRWSINTTIQATPVKDINVVVESPFSLCV